MERGTSGSARNEARGAEIGDVMDSRVSSGSVANHTVPRTLESPLKHCDSAQRATTGQPGATPKVLSATMRFVLRGNAVKDFCSKNRAFAIYPGGI